MRNLAKSYRLLLFLIFCFILQIQLLHCQTPSKVEAQKPEIKPKRSSPLASMVPRRISTETKPLSSFKKEGKYIRGEVLVGEGDSIWMVVCNKMKKDDECGLSYYSIKRKKFKSPTKWGERALGGKVVDVASTSSRSALVQVVKEVETGDEDTFDYAHYFFLTIYRITIGKPVEKLITFKYNFFVAGAYPHDCKLAVIDKDDFFYCDQRALDYRVEIWRYKSGEKSKVLEGDDTNYYYPIVADRKHIAFIRNPVRECRPKCKDEAQLLNIDSGEVRSLTNFAEFKEYKSSVDIQQIFKLRNKIYIQIENNEKSSIWQADLKTGEYSLVFSDKAFKDNGQQQYIGDARYVSGTNYGFFLETLTIKNKEWENLSHYYLFNPKQRRLFHFEIGGPDMSYISDIYYSKQKFYYLPKQDSSSLIEHELWEARQVKKRKP